MLIPSAEYVLSLLWIMGIRRERTQFVLASLMFIFTLAYVLQSVLSPAPVACGCWATAASADGGYKTLVGVVLRNMIIAALLLSAHWLPFIRHASTIARRSRVNGATARGFTVIELCLSIAIIAILTVLGVTHLAGSRTAARNRVNESNLRSHAAVFHAYATDYQDSMPAFQLNDDGSSTARCESADVEFPLPFFAMTRYWHFPLADQYYAGDYRSKSFLTPFNKGGSLQEVNYLLPCVYLAHPDLFTVEKWHSVPKQIAAQRLSHVTYPSQKSLLVAKNPWNLDGYVGLADARGRSTGVAAADGHAGTYRQDQMLLGAMREPSYVDGKFYSDHFTEQFPLIHSLGGIRARDLR